MADALAYPYRVWVSIVGPTYKDAIQQIQKASKIPGIIGLEMRLDRIKDHYLKELVDEAHHNLYEVVATTRSRSEGGEFDGDEDLYRRELDYAVESGADIIDIEINRLHLPEVPAGTRLLASCHETAGR